MIAVKRTSLLFGILFGALFFKERGLGIHILAGGTDAGRRVPDRLAAARKMLGLRGIVDSRTIISFSSEPEHIASRIRKE